MQTIFSVMKQPATKRTLLERGLSRVVAALGVACLVLGGCANQGAGTATNATATDATATNATATNAATSGAANNRPITIGISDWPGYLVWDIADQQGFFEKEGVNVELKWFPVYTDSLNAFAAGQLDANSQTWNDFLPPLSKGLDAKAMLMFDFSAGNDALIAQPGIRTIQQLRGKRVATELGTVDHYLLLRALASVGMTERDIQFVPMAIQDCPAAMIARRVDAAAVWEPSRTKILNSVRGSRVLFDSADIPGGIPDVCVMKTSVIENRREDVQKLVNAWYRAIDWWRANPDRAVAIMAARTNTPVADYKSFIMGTRILSAPEALRVMTRTQHPTSLHTSGNTISRFLIQVEQMEKMPDYASAIDISFTRAVQGKNIGRLPPYNYEMKIP